MHLLKLVWAVSLCIVHGESEGKPRLHPHRASVGDQVPGTCRLLAMTCSAIVQLQEGDLAMSISAAGQPVMRREAKHESEERDEMPTEHQQLALEHALHRVAELSEDLNPDVGYRESLLEKVKEIMDNDVHEQKQRTLDHQMASSKFMPKALVALSDVDGCQDAATAKVIEGYYVPAGTTSGKPSYKKDGSGSGEDEVWLYHYADIDAGSVGWWIGSNPSGRVHIYAFNPSKAAPWWGDVDSNMLVETLSQEEVPQDLVPTETPEEMVTEAPEVEDSFTVTEAPEESVEMETTAPEMEEKVEKLENKTSSVGKDLLQHVLKEEGEMITAAVAKLSSGKKLADMVFGTDTAVIPAEPPSAEMLEKLAKDPEMAKKALNRTAPWAHHGLKMEDRRCRHRPDVDVEHNGMVKDDYVMKVEEKTGEDDIQRKEMCLLQKQLQCLKHRLRRGGSDEVMNHYRNVQEDLSTKIDCLKLKCLTDDYASECSTRMPSRSWSLLSFFTEGEEAAKEADDEEVFSV
eukprot:symbB.v1.2.028966.t1/scaffold3123.1/size63075/4